MGHFPVIVGVCCIEKIKAGERIAVLRNIKSFL